MMYVWVTKRREMEEEIEESLVLEAGGGDTSVGETSWLHGKSQMLDEVKTAQPTS